MTLVAGVDVGNTTTEVVLSDTSREPPLPVAWDRAPTRGTKGTQTALVGAVALVRRLERRVGRRVELVAVTAQHAVDTATVTVPQSAPATGRFEIVTSLGDTPGSAGFGAGEPVWAHADVRPTGGPVVVLVPSGLGFRAAVEAVERWEADGADVRAVLLADDEGVLVAARLRRRIPVADQVDVDRAIVAVAVLVEVAAPGHPLQTLTDPLRLVAETGLGDSERADAVALAAALGDSSRAVVGLHARPMPVAMAAMEATITLRSTGERVALDPASLSSWPVGAVAEYRGPGEGGPEGGGPNGGGPDGGAIDDLWAVGLREVAESVSARIDPSTARGLVLATLRSGVGESRPDLFLARELGVRAHLVASEAAAARAGALTTPGARGTADRAIVVDLGGGTVDLIGPAGRHVVAAGGGELLTAAVATYLGLPRGAADWVKRAASYRLESPQLGLAEDGTRTFLDRAAPAQAVGSLVTMGPAGALPFGGSMAPTAWRALRLRLKQRVLADNVARAARSLGEDVRAATEVILVGGVVADEELLGLLRPVLPGLAVGRGDVAGRLGHRYAVAYGLTLLSPDSDASA